MSILTKIQIKRGLDIFLQLVSPSRLSSFHFKFICISDPEGKDGAEVPIYIASGVFSGSRGDIDLCCAASRKCADHQGLDFWDRSRSTRRVDWRRGRKGHKQSHG